MKFRQLSTMLDCKVTLYVGPHQFTGELGESDNPDETATLHVGHNLMHIDVSKIDAITVHLDNPQETQLTQAGVLNNAEHQQK
ncbi:hypothetical protein ACYPKM_02085 [Pseudomonas aeruginosa]